MEIFNMGYLRLNIDAIICFQIVPWGVHQIPGIEPLQKRLFHYIQSFALHINASYHRSICKLLV